MAGPGRLRFASFALERLPSGQCRAAVTLTSPGASFSGEARGLASQAGELRCAAQACINAIAQAIHDPGFDLVGVKSVRAFDANVIIASLALRGQADGPRIVGSYITEDDPPRGAAFAVLNATNRLLAGKLSNRT